ncbi:C4-dicarboxylate TRAP transporter substrate-binding protein [Ferrovibrio sp.]|uniref:C4-dicarboxylate TRAP transporter substrate-binding protein n=1 Tax=Ferrovibrio sp. TaxID=1917215 RepID=UPI003D0D8696
MKIAAIAAVGIALASAYAGEVMAQTKIVYASYLGPKHTSNPVMLDYFKNVERDTNGSLKFEPHFAQSLLAGKDIPAGVRDGIADSGYIVGSYVPSEMPVENFIGDFSLLNDDPLLMTGVINELVLYNCPDCKEEYETKFKVKFLSTIALTPYVYHCKPHIKSLADMKGKKLRAISGWVDMTRAMGAVPVNVNADEAYEALDRGTIDCAVHSITSQRSRSYGEAAKNVILNPIGGYIGASMFNLRVEKWNKLSKTERDALVKHLPEMVTRAVYNYVREDEEVMKEYSAKGTKFYNADPDLAKFLAEFPAKYMPTAIEKGKNRKVKNPEQIAANFEKLRVKWKGLLDKHGRDQATFQKLIWEEIYSKLPT